MSFDEEGLLTGRFREKEGWTVWLSANLNLKWKGADHNLIHFVSLYLIIGVLIIWMFISGSYLSSCRDPSLGFYSPASNVIKYETRVFPENFVNRGPYMGREEDGLPTAETDALWEDLYEFGISRINGVDAAQLPNFTTAIPNMPDSYVVELDVFHQLHCLNTLRKTLFPLQYPDQFTDLYTKEGQRNYTSNDARHYDHCIDTIRESLMCHADVATIYWQWIPSVRVPKPRLEVTHTCRDFEAIREWAKENELMGSEQKLRWPSGPKEKFQVPG